MPEMMCPRCQDGEIEFEIAPVDSGDGPWATSGVAGVVVWRWAGAMLNDAELGEAWRSQELAVTDCGCTWTAEALDALHERATRAAGEYSGS